MYATGTSGPVIARLLPVSMVLITALGLASGLPSAELWAAVDVASKVDVQIVARPGSVDAGAQAFRLRDGGVLRSGDGVQLRLESDADAYVYIVAYGSSNSAILLRPFSATPEDALLQRGQKEVIPGDGIFLPLDGQEGYETLFTIISDVPLQGIPDLLARIEVHGDDLSAITATIKATYPGVRRLTFRHIGASPLVGVAAVSPRAASSPATPGAAPEKPVGTEDLRRDAGVSLLPPAGNGWSVPSTQSFATGGAAATETAMAAAATADSSAPTQAAPAANESVSSGDGVLQAGAVASTVVPEAVGETDSPPVSSALRRAREAAGIDEQQFQGILAKLPGRGEADVLESARKPYKEQGVLGAEGSRIRALGRAQLESGESWPAGASSPNKSQN